MSIYVAVSPGDIDRLQPLLSCFFQQVINLLCTTLPERNPTVRHQARLILDEMPTIDAMPHLAKARRPHRTSDSAPAYSGSS